MTFKKRAVFIDRDGVIVKPVARKGQEKPTAPFCIEELSFFESIEAGMNLLKSRGFLCILATNQPDIEYGNTSYEEWQKIQKKVERFNFDDIFICFHSREAGCDCKKPKLGLLLMAQRKWGIDFKQSYIIGDTENDVAAGNAVGCQTILVDAWYNKTVESNFRTGSFLEAAQIICKSYTGR